MTMRKVTPVAAIVVAASFAPVQGVRAQTYDDVKEQAVEIYGSAKQYATDQWRKLFPEKVEICIGYGTEKETWLKKEVEKFAKNPDNKNLTIKLVPMGSLVGAEAIEKNGGRVGSGSAACAMTAWSPASAAYRDYVVQRTFRAMGASNALVPGIKAANDLIAAQSNSLVRIPLVFVMWPGVYQKVVDAAHKADPAATDDKIFTFDGLIKAEQTDAGDGSYTTFHMTRPSESNSGFSSLLLMGYEFTNAGRTGIDANAVSPRNSGFWSHVKQFYASTEGKSLKNFTVESTGTLFREQFLVNGPQSDISGVVTYENLAIQYADFAKKNYGSAYKVVYPARNVMSDNPYYVLNAAYDAAVHKTVVIGEKEKKAALAFMQFLMEPEQQRDAVQLGFRPGNIQSGIDIAGATSPFVTMREIGILTNPNVRFVGTANVSEAVISNLLNGWKDIETALK
jgi:hypothetical protein